MTIDFNDIWQNYSRTVCSVLLIFQESTAENK